MPVLGSFSCNAAKYFTNGPFSGGLRRGNFFGERQNHRCTTERTRSVVSLSNPHAQDLSDLAKIIARARSERSKFSQLSGEFRAAIQAMTQSAIGRRD